MLTEIVLKRIISLALTQLVPQPTLIIMTTSVNSESDLYSFFEQTPDWVCIAGPDGFFKNVNHAVENKLGYSKSELLASPISSFVHPEDKAATDQSRTNLYNGTPLVNFENRYVTKGGNIIWMYWTSIYLPDKKLIFGIAKDISERKKTENEIDEKYQKYKNLTNYFKSSIERDKKDFAKELQEELAQIASDIKRNLYSVLNLFPDIPELAISRIEQASYMSGLMLQMIDKIAFEISPFMLDDKTLDENLKLLCNDFSLLNELPSELETDYNVSGLSEELKVDFFRICQNVLKNIMNSSQAQSLKISIKDIGDKIQLTIADEGKGLEIKEPKQISSLANMRKRVASFSGKLDNFSNEEKGSRIVITVSR